MAGTPCKFRIIGNYGARKETAAIHRIKLSASFLINHQWLQESTTKSGALCGSAAEVATTSDLVRRELHRRLSLQRVKLHHRCIITF